MKANAPVTLAIVLWIVFWAENVFAVVKSPYPPKPEAPGDPIVIVIDEDLNPTIGGR